jgi:tetratricopeptide (TPR) repeat protein
MSNIPASATTREDSADDLEILEWDRIRSFLKAPSVPLAIMEIESPDHSDDVLAALGQIAGSEHVHVFRARGDEDFRRPLDWLEEQEDDQGVFVITDVQEYTREEDVACDFWTWANAQRERWPREHGHVVFLLQPEQVDYLCRYAPMLWDWIPLKFNLIRRESAEHRVPATRKSYAAAMHRVARRQEPDREPGADDERSERLQAARLEALREQLLRARQKGLPEHLVRRNFAWPLFRELVETDRIDEAHRVLETELGYEFPTELPFLQAMEGREQLKRFLSSLNPRRAKHAETAVEFYLDSAGGVRALLRSLGVCVSHVAFSLIALTGGESDAAEGWLQRWRAINDKLGFDEGLAITYYLLGVTLMQRGDHINAKQWYRRAFSVFEKLGHGEQSMDVLRHLGFVEIAEKSRGPIRPGITPPLFGRHSPQPSSPMGRMVRAVLMSLARRIERRARKRWLDQPAGSTSGPTNS